MSVRPVVEGRVVFQVRVPREVSHRQGIANRHTDARCPYCFQRGIHNRIQACRDAARRRDA